MTKEYPAKSFKSGNSVAIRMPAELGISPGQDWIVEEQDGKLVLERKPRAKRKFNIDKIWGSATNLTPIDPDNRWFEERPLNWGNQEG